MMSGSENILVESECGFFTGENTDQMFVSVASDQQLYDGDSKTTVVKTSLDNQDAVIMLCSMACNVIYKLRIQMLP